MATLVLQAAGAAIGSVFGPVGAVIGRAAGALAGAAIDQSLLSRPGGGGEVVGPRLSDLTVQTSTEGAAVPRIYGRVRLAGQIIWATEYEEVVRVRQQGGGKGAPAAPATTTRTYSYFANFAVGLCEGPVHRIGRVWADGKPLDLSDVTMRVYHGDEVQEPDSLIAAKEGADRAPAYRGLAYVVFERLALARFGNRIPQLSFEVTRGVGGLEERLRAVTVIPGATEFGYDTAEVLARLGRGVHRPENRHFGGEGTDWGESIDELQALCPAVEQVGLVVSWFGDDLRCGECSVTPRIEMRRKTTRGGTWQVSGIGRGAARLVSHEDDRPAYGGTPSDRSVINAIRDLKARGLKVAFYPFLMMDIPPGNALPDPWSGAAGQPAHPWRGRITCDPAPGREGSPDKTAAAEAEVAAFFGNATRQHFVPSGNTVFYTGPADWGWRRMVLHYAHLCALAGGVDTFLICSELRELARVRAGAGSYPAVAELRALAAEVRGVLGPDTQISYAADWSDWFGHQPADGTGDVHFHLDPLWADEDIDFVGIDSYVPLADWRDGEDHLDAGIAGGPYDPDDLRGNVAGGEGYDWYYESEADRTAQVRTPITDGAYGKPWVFRFKDVTGWWANLHYDRPGGVEAGEPTAWVPQGKPIVFTEIGCPAIDKGANQPNVFLDAKSSESHAPYFSNGERDDLIQRRALEALHDWWDPEAARHVPGANPVSAVYGGHAVDASRLTAWTWDARPYPLFPLATDIWSDGPNWERGHWLNGRLGIATLDRLVGAIAADYGLDMVDASALEGIVGGYVIDRPMSARAALEPLMQAFLFDASQSGETLRFRHRGRPAAATIDTEDVAVAEAGDAPFERRRVQESELPARVSLRYLDAATDHRPATAGERRIGARAGGESVIELPAAIDQGVAVRAAGMILQDAWTAREQVAFALPLSRLALEPGDVMRIDHGEGPRTMLLGAAEGGLMRRIEARAVDRRDYRVGRGPERTGQLPGASAIGPPETAVIEPVLLPGMERPALMFAAFADPWAGAVEVYVERPGGTHEPVATITRPSTFGVLAEPLAPGNPWRWDRGSELLVDLFGGMLTGADEGAVLDGANALTVETAAGWEVVQFARAEPVVEGRYLLRDLLRGQSGSEAAAALGAAAGARALLLDEGLAAIALLPDAVGLQRSYRFVPAGEAMNGLAAVTETVTPAGFGYRPLSPVHVRARRESGGDIRVTWIRRTRRGGDSWQIAEVPLGEDTEGYEIEVAEAGAARRTAAAAAPEWIYSASDQAADWGGPAGAFTFRVMQMSAVTGRGAPREARIDV